MTGIRPGRDLESEDYAHIPLPVRQNSLNWRGRERRTHKNRWNLENIKRKGLMGILKANFDIRGRNERCREKDEEFVANPTAQDARPGSPQESELTVETKDWDLLKSSKTLLEKVKDWLTPERLAECEKADTSTSRRPSTPPDDNEAPSSKKKSKLSVKARPFCVVKKRPGRKIPIAFPDVLFQYANYYHESAMPLALFTNNNLKKLIRDPAPKCEKQPMPDGTKEWMLNLEFFCTKHKILMGDATLDNYMDWVEAIDNWAAFKEKRDPEGVEGAYTQFAENHLEFFDVQEDKVELYYLWKKLELELRRRRFEEFAEFDEDEYDQEMKFLQHEKKADVKQKEREAKRRRVTESRGTSWFQGGNREEKKSSGLLCCLICGARGHKAAGHGSNNGPPRWVKVENGSIFHPKSGKGVCIHFNIFGVKKGERSCRDCNLEHVCSFCGESSHHAFKWQCTSKPPKRN
ncbi:hypothetical protein AAF712_016333 [Marasmius tenuissimus]|uniref:Uncharacterized protein n=1 Tax=Marasmius tenuissimus TaxID=585030 RepID=A0ABR2Z865_9AGAR